MAEANRERLIRTSRTARTFERYEVYEAYESLKSFKWSRDALAFFPLVFSLRPYTKKKKILGQLYALEVDLVSGSKPCFGQTKTLAPRLLIHFVHRYNGKTTKRENRKTLLSVHLPDD